MQVGQKRSPRQDKETKSREYDDIFSKILGVREEKKAKKQENKDKEQEDGNRKTEKSGFRLQT